MFDDLEKKLKKGFGGRGKENGEEENRKDREKDVEKPSFLGNLHENIKSTTTDIAVETGELPGKILDRPIRAAGYIKGKFMPPKTRTDSSFIKEKTWFFCAHCKDEMGPVDKTKWGKILKLAGRSAQVATGAVMLNPFWVAKGTAGFAGATRNEPGMISSIMKERSDRKAGKQFLLQCEYCGEWVCSTCWELEKDTCNKCHTDGITRAIGFKERSVSIDGIRETALDGSLRNMGSVKRGFVEPRTETEKTGGKHRTWFFCTHCSDRLGPVETSRWSRFVQLAATGTGIILGAATFSPIKVVSGSVKFVNVARGENSIMDDVRKEGKDRKTDKHYILQCQYCGEWVCSSCWDVDKQVCAKCVDDGLKRSLKLPWP